jgi:hypothetical protein
LDVPTLIQVSAGIPDWLSEAGAKIERKTGYLLRAQSSYAEKTKTTH